MRAVMVNLTTQKPHSDTTVVLARGDHPFIRHATVVNYSDARFVEAGHLEAALESGLFQFGSRCDPDVLKRIQDGLLRSRFTTLKIRTYCASRF